MDQEKIGKFIKDIRLKENLSQQKFAQKYNVTYQAVSKWENGKSIPDIAILKQMCSDYDMNLDDFLEAKISKSKNEKRIFNFIMLIFLIIIGISILIITFNKNNHFEFKTLSSNCNNFDLYGSMAYNDNKSSIYISNITYCGMTDEKEYETIECTLYETSDKRKIEISKCTTKENNLLTLNEFLKTVNINVDNYVKTCKPYKENSFYLEIEAKESNGKITIYKIPLQLNDNCEK